jgi:hypothetical protein
MNDDLAVSIAMIERGLQRLERRVLQRSLRPGVPVVAVQEALGGVGLEASQELLSLYGWRDGTSTAHDVTLDDIHLFPGFYLLSLADSVANYQAFVEDARWRTGWLPIFANGGGDFYVLDLGSSAGGGVRHFRIDEAEHPIEFGSLTAMLRTLAEAFERALFFVDSSGYLEMNDLAFGDLAAELNPDVSWWRE